MGRAILYAKIDPGSVNLEKLAEGYRDLETGQAVPLPMPVLDRETERLTPSVPAILQKRFGTLIEEAVVGLPPGRGIRVTKDVRSGVLELEVPSECAEQVKQTLEALRSQNTQQIWQVGVVYREETGHSPAGCGSHVEEGTEPRRRLQEPPAIGSGKGIRPIQPLTV